MARAVTLANFRPSERADADPWTEARVDEADRFDGPWSELKTIELDPVDENPAEPSLRSFTVGSDKEWLRIVFLDGDGNEDEPSAVVATTGHPFRPTAAHVSAILRARTYTDEELVSEFNSDTSPTAEEIENDLIPQSGTDLIRGVGPIPGVRIEDARRVNGLGVAAEIERSYLPEQAEPDASTFQTLRRTFAEESQRLRQALQWFALTQRQEAS